jgi:hypothetical protein
MAKPLEKISGFRRDDEEGFQGDGRNNGKIREFMGD